MGQIVGFPTCKHIKTDGVKCESPSMSGRHFCYYHSLYRQRNKPNKRTPQTLHAPMIDAEDHWHRVEVMDPFAKRYTLGPLEDANAVQVAISTVLNALADNRIDITRASTLLYGLQLASSNLRHLDGHRNCGGALDSPATCSTAGTYAQVPPPEELTLHPHTEAVPNQELGNSAQG